MDRLPPHPMQPVYLDKNEVVRFKPNKIVQYLLDNGGIDLNRIACLDFPQEDREQFAQLIGYSVGGFAELSYVTDKTYKKAFKLADNLWRKKDGKEGTEETQDPKTRPTG